MAPIKWSILPLCACIYVKGVMEFTSIWATTVEKEKVIEYLNECPDCARRKLGSSM